MTVVGITCKFLGASAAGAKPRVAVDANRDGQMQQGEEVSLAPATGSADWAGQLTVPSHTMNMLILVAYEMDVGTKLTVEATNAVTAKSLWKREITAVSSRVGWVLGHMGW